MGSRLGLGSPGPRYALVRALIRVKVIRLGLASRLGIGLESKEMMQLVVTS